MQNSDEMMASAITAFKQWRDTRVNRAVKHQAYCRLRPPRCLSISRLLKLSLHSILVEQILNVGLSWHKISKA